MGKGLKIGLILGGTLALVGGAIGLTLWFTSDKHKENKDKKEQDKATEEANKGDKNLSSSDVEKLVGKEVWAKDASGVAIRTSAEINNSVLFKNSSDVSWYDFYDNGIVENAKDLIGKLVRVEVGADKRDWYYIELSAPIKGYKYGYVRSDVVTIK